MQVLKKIKRVFSKDAPWTISYYFLRFTHLDKYVPDETYLKLKYRCYTGKELNLNPPRTFNEKLQWLKLHDHNPLYTTLVDKYAVKKWVADKIGEEYIIPTLGVWENADDIDFDSLPNQFVLKCNHDSGSVIICKNKETFDISSARKKLNKQLKRDCFVDGREWPYKNVHRRIIAEKYMTDDGEELKDYKVFTFDGEPKIIEIDYNRFKGHLRNLYNEDWVLIDAQINYPSDPYRIFERPKALEEMLDLSRSLSKGFPHLRTDFYIVDEKIFFGELTFFHENGMGHITPDTFDKVMGEWIKLPTMGGAIFKKGNIFISVKQFDLIDQRRSGLCDYKFFCFNGVPKMLFVATERQTREEPFFDFFDMDYNHVDLRSGHPNAIVPPAKPAHFDKMKELAKVLSDGFRHVRVDFYEINGRVYFGEMTFYHHTGMVLFDPPQWNTTFGNWINLPQ